MWRYVGERGRRAPYGRVSEHTYSSTLSITHEKAARGFTIYVKYMLLLERSRNLLLAGLKFYLGVFEGESLLLRLENAL